jgi:FKBP-type peptidyl-prolyl cis-trans isomerase FkpA
MIGFCDARQTRTQRVVGLLVAAFVLIVAGSVSAKEPKTDEDKTLYFIGVLMSRNFEPLALTPAESEMVLQGLQDSIKGKTVELDEEVYLEKVQAFANTRAEASVEKEKVKSKEYLEKAGKAKGAKITESGLIYTESKAGSGNSPSPTDTVKVHYHGTLSDGTVFDSSVERNEPMEFPLNRVIPCWTEGVGMMKPGGKAKLVCPPELAYGDRGSPGRIPGGAVLTFDVELIEIVATP